MLEVVTGDRLLVSPERNIYVEAHPCDKTDTYGVFSLVLTQSSGEIYLHAAVFPCRVSHNICDSLHHPGLISPIIIRIRRVVRNTFLLCSSASIH
jgi:hypothetical protein